MYLGRGRLSQIHLQSSSCINVSCYCTASLVWSHSMKWSFCKLLPLATVQIPVSILPVLPQEKYSFCWNVQLALPAYNAAVGAKHIPLIVILAAITASSPGARYRAEHFARCLSHNPYLSAKKVYSPYLTNEETGTRRIEVTCLK